MPNELSQLDKLEQQLKDAGCILGMWDGELRLIGPWGIVAKGKTMKELLESI